MLVYELVTVGSPYKIVAAVLASAAFAADSRNNVACRVDNNSIAGQFLYPAYEKDLRGSIPLSGILSANRPADYRVGKYHRLSLSENIAVNPIHYHSAAGFQLGRKTSRRYREDSESVCADCPDEEQCQSQRHKELDCYFQIVYLMLSTNWKSLFHLMPEKPGWSGLWLHQMNMGLPTMWSSGTNPQ